MLRMVVLSLANSTSSRLHLPHYPSNMHLQSSPQLVPSSVHTRRTSAPPVLAPPGFASPSATYSSPIAPFIPINFCTLRKASLVSRAALRLQLARPRPNASPSTSHKSTYRSLADAAPNECQMQVL